MKMANTAPIQASFYAKEAAVPAAYDAETVNLYRQKSLQKSS